jgi:capsular exopolysaccharide synthesis family protein
MSRIYEALQKAESERKPERRDEEAPKPEQAAVVEMRSHAAVAEEEYVPAPIPVSVAEPAYTQPAYAQPAYAQPAYTEPAYAEPAGLRSYVGSGLDLSGLVRRPWSLSLDKLPSLLEHGPAVEQFRSLRSRIYELRDINPLKSILVTSGMPQEGKSFIAANLALSLARHKNSKVLLIDGDMRRYTLHQLLGCESHPGLADYLAGKAGPVDIMQRADSPAETDVAGRLVLSNLTFIPAGNGGDKAADLSGSQRFGDLIRLAAPSFDWIIVDSSPVLPVSDAVNLARSCDGVLLVARGGVTKFPIAQRAQSELKASNVLGFVLNAVLDAPQDGGYYGYDASKQ